MDIECRGNWKFAKFPLYTVTSSFRICSFVGKWQVRLPVPIFAFLQIAAAVVLEKPFSKNSSIAAPMIAIFNGFAFLAMPCSPLHPYFIIKHILWICPYYGTFPDNCNRLNEIFSSKSKKFLSLFVMKKGTGRLRCFIQWSESWRSYVVVFQ